MEKKETGERILKGEKVVNEFISFLDVSIGCFEDVVGSDLNNDIIVSRLREYFLSDHKSFPLKETSYAFGNNIKYDGKELEEYDGQRIWKDSGKMLSEESVKSFLSKYPIKDNDQILNHILINSATETIYSYRPTITCPNHKNLVDFITDEVVYETRYRQIMSHVKKLNPKYSEVIVGKLDIQRSRMDVIKDKLAQKLLTDQMTDWYDLLCKYIDKLISRMADIAEMFQYKDKDLLYMIIQMAKAGGKYDTTKLEFREFVGNAMGLSGDTPRKYLRDPNMCDKPDAHRKRAGRVLKWLHPLAKNNQFFEEVCRGITQDITKDKPATLSLDIKNLTDFYR